MAVDFATIGLKSDTTGLKKGEEAMNRFARNGERTERRIKKSSVAMSGAINAVGASAVRMAAVAGAALGAFMGGKLFLGAIREQEQLQRNMLKTQSIIEATGGAAGKSADQLLNDARAIARATLQSTEGIMAAQQVMLTFRNVTGDTFDAAIGLAADMSEALGTDMKSAVLQLGKALEDPVTGMTALTRSGTVFTTSQKDMVKAMVEAGNAAGAQAFILGELEKQYGGVARAAAAGLGGVMDTLGQSFQEFQIALANSAGLGVAASNSMSGLASILDFLAQNMDVVINSGIIAAGVYAGPVVVSFIAGKVAALGFAGALGLVKSALVLTGIGALIVGAGVLVTWFQKLVKGAGGFGSAMGLLGDLTAAVWSDIKSGAWSLYLQMQVVENEITFGWTVFLSKLSMLWSDFLGIVAADLEKLPFTDALTGSLRTAQSAARNSSLDYNDSLIALDNSMEELGRQQKELAERTSSTAPALAALTAAMASGGDVTDGAAAATANLSDALNDLPTAAKATGSAVETLGDKLKSLGKDALAKVGAAFSDFFNRGFKDFGSFAKSILKTFGQMLLKMIAMAAKNKIMLNISGGAGGGFGNILGKLLGGGGTVAGTTAAAKTQGGGGLLSGVGAAALGGFGTAAVGGTAAVAGTGLLGGLGSTLGVGAAAGASTGLFGIGAGAAAAGGTLMATIGAALPLIGIGVAIFMLFKALKKKPPISQKDFRIIQTGLSLTGKELLGTGYAGQVAAASLKKLFGGVKNFTKITESYYSNFFTNEEKRQRAIEGISGVFDSMGLAMPATAEEFRGLVEAQDLTTSAGQKTYASLLKVSEAFAAVFGGVSNTTKALVTLSSMFGGDIFSTLVDQKRALAYQNSGTDYLTARPETVGQGLAYRGAGPRMIDRKSYEAEVAAAKQADEIAAQTKLLQGIMMDNKKLLRLQQQWEGIGMPPARV